MKKRFFSVLLVLCMALSLLPFGTAAAEIVKEGSFDGGPTWTLDSSGLLTISGSGTMYNRNNFSPFEGNKAIQEVVIGNGVKDIGSSAFNGCTNLKKVTIPESVVSIKDFAFAGCTSLESLTIPSATSNIWLDRTFSLCSSLTGIHVSAENSKYSSKDGVLFNKDQTELLCCPAGKTGEYTIPDGVESIHKQAFAACINLTKVTIPGSVKSIGNNAFYYCTGLKSMDIPEGVERIGSWAFQDCPELHEMTIPASVTEIGDHAFANCCCRFSVSDNSESFSSVDGVLYNKDQTELLWHATRSFFGSFEIPQGVTTIGEYAFFNSPALTNLTIPVSVTRIENSAFYWQGTAFKMTVNYGGTRQQWSAISIGHSNDRLFRDVHCIDDPDSTPPPTPTPTPTPKTEDPDLDTDGDGLYDVWEIKGFDYNGDGEVDIDLPKMGADPNKVDIFVEIDWMTGCKPSSAALKTVYEQFRKHNINLHLDAGMDSIDFVTGKAWGVMSGGNEVEHKDKTRVLHLDFDILDDGTVEAQWHPWVEKINDSFKSYRKPVFKYCLFVDQLKVNVTKCSGIANNMPGQYFVVAHDVINGDVVEDADTAIAGTFMHELGHTLGLHHGGDEDENYKPNYLSVMNYSFQRTGLAGTNEINYSEYVLPAINEASINENKGVDPNGVIKDSRIGTKWKVENKTHTADCAGGQIDFNLDGKIEKNAKCDFNFDGEYKTVFRASINDWEHLVFKADSIGMKPANGVSYTDEELNSLTLVVNPEVIQNEVASETDAERGDDQSVKNPFVDVKSGAYYYDPVLWAVNHNPQITAGTSATTFSPGATCTRGQVVTFLWRAAGQPEPKSTKNPFKDVSKDAYYYKAVLWAAEQEITAGTSATTFSPNDPCTRAHVVTFLWRSEGKPTPGGKNPFQDVGQGKYYTDAVLWAVAEKITAGTSATAFSPASPCTRGQIVTFLYRDKQN